MTGDDAFEVHKQLISDALRNAAMRFGVALDLWSKEDLHGAQSPSEDSDPWSDATTEQRTTAAGLQDLLEHLPPDIADKALAKIRKRAGLEAIDNVTDLDPGWLSYWSGLLSDAKKAADQ